jgi:hypothetical protein
MPRPRVVGKCLPLLETVLHNPKTVWQRITVDWYGEGKRIVEVCTATALWYRYGSDPLAIRWVLTRDPEGKRPRNPRCFQPIKAKQLRRLFSIS